MSEQIRDKNLKTLERRFPGIRKIIEDQREKLLEKEE